MVSITFSFVVALIDDLVKNYNVIRHTGSAGAFSR
jgi:hypothetical protein